MTILLLSQDQTHAQEIQEELQKLGYPVAIADQLETLWQLFLQTNPDLLVLDVISYDRQMSLTLCRDIRQNPTAYRTPLLLVSPFVDPQSVAEFLDVGADDLVPHPLDARVLGARVRALLRWSNKKSYNPKPQIRLQKGKHLVLVDDQREVWLTPIEFRLIQFLCDHQDRYFSADELLVEVWNYPQNQGDTALVRNHIRNLRRKLEVDADRPTILVSRYGQGYTVEAVVHQS